MLLLAVLVGWNRTLRKKVLERTAALGESEQRFRGLVELMPVAVYVCDTSGIIQSYNKRAAELWGREPKLGEAVQCYCGSLRLYSPNGKLVRHAESPMAEVLKTGVEARDVEMVVERPDGSCITTLVNIALLRNADGELIGAMNCFQDISERKQAEEALRQSEERFAAFMDKLPGYAWMKDLQGRYVYVNEMVRGLPGYRSLGKTDAQIWPADLAAEYRANDQQVIAAKKPLHTVEHYLHEGKQRYMVGSKFPIFDKTGAVALVGGAGVDITERIDAEEALRESEHRLRTILRTAMDGFWRTDVQGRFLEVNETYCRMSGYSEQELLAMSISDVEAQETPSEVVAHIRSIMVRGEDRFESRHRRKDGSIFPVEVSAQYRTPDGGQMVAFLRDITERKRVEMALQKNEQHLSETQVLGRTGSWEHNLVTGEIANTE